ncbi:MAG: hypothetical protein RQ751_02375 [Longimicrobiales bacterium]|nr:hypothetical protein [Longimicrobiales bacterium]
MSVVIEEVRSRTQRREWVRFPLDHYRGHPRYVPQILSDEVAYFDPRKNPSFQVAAVRMFTARRGGRVVGRICAIVNRLEWESAGRRVGRFGWFETVEDPDVAHGLLHRAAAWCRTEGCVRILGPLGFTDLDPSGILVEGHDQVPTIAGSYQYPYYPRLLEEFGFRKEVDYLEYRMDVSKPIPFLERMRGRLSEEGYRITSPGSRRELRARADDFWALLERTYAHLFGVVPLTPEQTRFYTRKYLSFLDPDFVKFCSDETGRLVGFFVGIPNLSRAFRRAWGRLLPTGFWHILRDYRRPSTVDLLLAAADPADPTDVLTARGLLDMLDVLRRRGVTYMEANRQLETNTRVHRIWRKFPILGTRRIRIYGLDL